MPLVRFLFALLAGLPVGHSVAGRPLAPVVLGSAPAAHRLLVVGCIHGTEPAGLAIVRALRPVAGAEIVVLRSLNADGCARGTRGNARGIDLNRDFASGARAEQPETRYFRTLVRAVRPAVTVFFHQHEDRVRAWGRSRATARRFAELLGGLLPYDSVPWPPGAATRWQNGLPVAQSGAAFVVELPAGPVPARLVPRYVRALVKLARDGFVR